MYHSHLIHSAFDYVKTFSIGKTLFCFDKLIKINEQRNRDNAIDLRKDHWVNLVDSQKIFSFDKVRPQY